MICKTRLLYPKMVSLLKRILPKARFLSGKLWSCLFTNFKVLQFQNIYFFSRWNAFNLKTFYFDFWCVFYSLNLQLRLLLMFIDLFLLKLLLGIDKIFLNLESKVFAVFKNIFFNSLLALFFRI
jgi:hypothetical protein